MIFREADLETFARTTGGEYVPFSRMSRVHLLSHTGLDGKPSQKWLTYVSPEMAYARLGNVLLKGAHSVVFSPEKALYVVRRLSHRDYEPLWDAGAWTRATPEGLEADLNTPDLHITEPAFLLSLCNNNYGHFVWEGLGRAYALSRIPGHENLKVIVPDNLPKRFGSWFEAVGIARERLLPISEMATVKVDTLYVATTPFGRDANKTMLAHEESLHYMRHLARARVPNTAQRTRLFISRSDSKDKRCVNEPDVIKLLEPHGFRTITGTNTSPEEQLDLVGRAEIIVAALGAATAVAAFAPQDCMIVEMTPLLEIFGMYNATMSSLILGQPLARVPGFRVILPDNPRAEPLWWDYGMDLANIQNVLNAFLNQPRYEA